MDLHGRRVLVVDDNEAAALLLTEMLLLLNFKAQHVDSGAAALEEIDRAMAQNSPYDFVLMDWLMPEMDGLEAVCAMRAQHSTHCPVVLMVSASRRQELLSGAEALGISHVLDKPVDSSLLLDTMMQLAHAEPAKFTPVATVKGSIGALEAELQQLAGTRVLVVEDNEINQQVAAELLQSVGLDVHLADNGRIGVEMVQQSFAQQRPYDLVFMDMQMPVMGAGGGKFAAR